MNSKFKTVIGRTIVVFFIIAGILSFASLHSLTLANAWLIGLGSLAVAAAPGVVFANKDKYVLTFRRPALRIVAWIGVVALECPILTFFGADDALLALAQRYMQPLSAL